MEKFTSLTATACPIDIVNLNTDALLPARFLKLPRAAGLGKFLLLDLRCDAQGAERGDFPLNRPAWRDARILVARRNFGCGSSREAAVYALLDHGIRCVIAPSFADIFYNNCFKNGILPVILPQESIDKLLDDAERGANAIVSIDLEKQEIRGPDGGCVAFEIDSFRKQCLLNGWDDIGLTLKNENKISDFEARRKAEAPWL